MRVYIHTCIYTYIHMHWQMSAWPWHASACTYVDLYVMHIHTYIHIYAPTVECMTMLCLCMYDNTYIYANMCLYVCSCLCVCMLLVGTHIHAYTSVYIHTYIHTQVRSLQERFGPVKHIRLYIYTHTYTHRFAVWKSVLDWSNMWYFPLRRLSTRFWRDPSRENFPSRNFG